MHPSSELQKAQRHRCDAAFRELGIEAILGGSGITAMGGTPGHRWLEVAVDGHPIGLKVLAATMDEAEQQLDTVETGVLGQVGIARSSLSVVKPDGWPIQGFFGSW
jgi:hypothetical protein